MTMLRQLPVVLLCILLCQCSGYQLGGSKPAQLAGVDSLHVPTFGNQTSLIRAQVMMTNSVVDQMTTEGTYQVASADKADAILRGQITSINFNPLRFARDDALRPQELVLSMRIDYQVVDRMTGKVLLNDSVTSDTNTFIEENFQTSRYSVLPEASRLAAVQLVNKITHGL